MFPRNDVGINETRCTTSSTMLHARWIKGKSPSGILTSALLFIEIATKGCGSEKFHAFIRFAWKGISEGKKLQESRIPSK